MVCRHVSLINLLLVAHLMLLFAARLNYFAQLQVISDVRGFFWILVLALVLTSARSSFCLFIHTGRCVPSFPLSFDSPLPT